MIKGQKATRIQEVYNLVKASQPKRKTKEPHQPLCGGYPLQGSYKRQRPLPLYILAQPHKIQTKEFFNFWISITPPPPKSKPISFLPKGPKDVQRYRYTVVMEDQFVNSVDVLLEEIDQFVGKSRKTK